MGEKPSFVREGEGANRAWVEGPGLLENLDVTDETPVETLKFAKNTLAAIIYSGQEGFIDPSIKIFAIFRVLERLIEERQEVGSTQE